MDNFVSKYFSDEAYGRYDERTRQELLQHLRTIQVQTTCLILPGYAKDYLFDAHFMVCEVDPQNNIVILGEAESASQVTLEDLSDRDWIGCHPLYTDVGKRKQFIEDNKIKADTPLVFVRLIPETYGVYKTEGAAAQMLVRNTNVGMRKPLRSMVTARPAKHDFAKPAQVYTQEAQDAMLAFLRGMQQTTTMALATKNPLMADIKQPFVLTILDEADRLCVTGRASKIEYKRFGELTRGEWLSLDPGYDDPKAREAFRITRGVDHDSIVALIHLKPETFRIMRGKYIAVRNAGYRHYIH